MHRNKQAKWKKGICYKQTKKTQPQKKELSETEGSCLLDEGIKVIVIQMLIKLCRQVDKLSENFNKEVKKLFKKGLIRTEEYNNWNEKYTWQNQQQKITQKNGSAIRKTGWWQSPYWKMKKIKEFKRIKIA